MLTVLVRDILLQNSKIQIFSKMENVVVCRQTWIHLRDCLDKCRCNGCDTEVRLRLKQLVMCPLSTSVHQSTLQTETLHIITRKWAATARYLSKTTITKPRESETVVTSNPSTLSVFVSVAWETRVVAILVVMMRCKIITVISWMIAEDNEMKPRTVQYTPDKISPQYIHSSFVSLNRQLGGILTCNLNITISSNHIWISAPLIEPVDTWNKQSVTVSSCDHIKHFISAWLHLLSLSVDIISYDCAVSDTR